MASCASTNTTFGGLIALQNLLDAGTTPPAIVSISYGECEAANGPAANSTYSSAYQLAVAEGVSVFVSAGDSGAAACDPDQTHAQHGINVNGLASTPYNVAVGGTDFSDTYSGTNSKYWSGDNTASFSSAVSYIPEIPWNSSCGSVLLSTYNGYNQTWGASGFCNSFLASFFGYQTTAAGGGGPSGCATGIPYTSGVVNGTCQGYPKPSWQSGLTGNPNDGVRDLPDVSLFAANGTWLHYYVYCFSDISNGGAACPANDPSSWSSGGGTSFSAPIMAGIQALVNQSTGTRWGNPNPKYYSLAAAEYGSGGTSTCLSSNTPASTCIFNDITQGDMNVPCSGTIECYGSDDSKGIYGVLTASPYVDTLLPTAYGTGSGWDFATGIGSVNVYNLVTNWGHSKSLPIAVSVTPSSASGSTQTFTAVFADPGGLISNLTTARILINFGVFGPNACYAEYNLATNGFFLVNNANNGLIGPLAPGSSSSLSNGQCTLNGSGSTVSTKNNTLTVNYSITFNASFAGLQNIYLAAYIDNNSTGFVQEGSYLVSFGPASVDPVSPSSGYGPSETFTATYSDANGISNITSARILFNTSVNGVSACYAFYYPQSNSLYLSNNANNGLIGPLTPGSSSSISNSQCILNGKATTVQKSGNNLTVAFALSFAPGFAGAKNVYLAAYTPTTNTGFLQKGNWTVSFGPPTVVSVSPNSGTGGTQTFSATYSDPAGISDLVSVRLLVSSGYLPIGVGACYTEYFPKTNALYLVNDANNGLLGPVTPGSTASVSNSQCTLNGAGTTVSITGTYDTEITVASSLVFSSAFSGSKNVFLAAYNSTTNTGFIYGGSWTVYLGPPTVVSVSPSSGTGLAQTFSATYSDPNGTSDLASVRLLLNTAINGVSACYAEYLPKTNALYLVNDSNNGLLGPIAPGSTSSLSNSQCTLEGSGTTVSITGTENTDITVAFSLAFSSTFTGLKNVYLAAYDPTTNTGFIQKGSWTP